MEHRQSPILTSLDGGADATLYDGEELLNEVFDLMRRRLPKIPVDDPARPALTALLPALAESLGRPLVVPVRGDRAQA